MLGHSKFSVGISRCWKSVAFLIVVDMYAGAAFPGSWFFSEICVGYLTVVTLEMVPCNLTILNVVST